MKLSEMLFTFNGVPPSLQPLLDALSGTPTEPLELHEQVYIAAYLQKYWLDEYCQPEPGDDEGPPSDDDLHQSAFADWVDMFSGRRWGMEYDKVRILGYYCSEVENTVPDEWLTDNAWTEVARVTEWHLECMFTELGTLYRVCMYAEGGFDLQFWFLCNDVLGVNVDDDFE